MNIIMSNSEDVKALMDLLHERFVTFAQVALATGEPVKVVVEYLPVQKESVQ